MQNIYFFITNWNYLFIIYNVIQTIMFYLVCFKFNINELKYNENKFRSGKPSKFGQPVNLYQGVKYDFEDDEDEAPISTPEEFLERFNTEKKKGASEIVENFIGQFGEDYQNAFDAIFVKGVDPKEYFGTYNQVVNFAEMDLSQEVH